LLEKYGILIEKEQIRLFEITYSFFLAEMRESQRSLIRIKQARDGIFSDKKSSLWKVSDYF
jgi:hypothetical protein